MKEQMEKQTDYLMLNEEERHTLYDKAKDANNAALPMDCEDYAADHEFIAEALRLFKATGAGEKERKRPLDELWARKG